MSASPVELVLLWHHHQPDYRRPHDGCAMLPWVRLHAAKDYLDMALRLERHPRVRCTFNFVPSLLDQLDDAEAGGADLLFDLLAQRIDDQSPDEREEIVRRCVQAPRHALERWPAYRSIVDRVRRSARAGARSPLNDRELARLESWFLLAWIDPMFHGEPEARDALAAAPDLTEAHRDALLALHARLVGRVLGAYRVRAAAGQVELSISPYYHPILPLLVDVKSARRARPAIALPQQPFAAPEDARAQIVRARARAAQAFGATPGGMWPPEGSVSPEAVGIARACGVTWLATDEGVLWSSLDPDERRREALYRPWRLATDAGDALLFFRDHELSDRIGFVYQNWRTEDAVDDFLARLRRIGREATGTRPPVISVMLDGENCWEQYADDGGPFLDALYAALDRAPDIVMRTPRDYVATAAEWPALPRLHTGSWIDADFHIWIGHAEKNRGWDWIARTRAALVEAGHTPEGSPLAWEALYAAEGSDWFWWFGDDHYTSDKALFDQLFRLQLRAAHERAGIPIPAALDAPIVGVAPRVRTERTPLGFVSPTIDGERTGFYEWHGAGRYRFTGGGTSMHQGGGLASDLYFGVDATRLHLRVDFASEPPGEEHALLLEFLAPAPAHVLVAGLGAGNPAVTWSVGAREGQRVDGAQAAVRSLAEVSIPFASLGWSTGQPVEWLVRILHRGQPVETLPGDDVIRFQVPAPEDAARMWSA